MFEEHASDVPLIEDDSEARSAEAPARCCNTGLFDDVPPAVWRVFLVGWAVAFSLFVLFFASDRASAFSIFISCLFVMMAFGLPIALAGQSSRKQKPGRMVETLSGPLTAWEAGAQIASIPMAAVLALVCFILLAK